MPTLPTRESGTWRRDQGLLAGARQRFSTLLMAFLLISFSLTSNADTAVDWPQEGWNVVETDKPYATRRPVPRVHGNSRTPTRVKP